LKKSKWICVSFTWYCDILEITKVKEKITKMNSEENIEDIFTKRLPAGPHKHLVKKMNMRELATLQKL
jgi:hypothetical protein